MKIQCAFISIMQYAIYLMEPTLNLSKLLSYGFLFKTHSNKSKNI